MSKNILIIGIAGGSGSGKTTLADNLRRRFGDDITLIRHDDYYRAHDDMTYEERAKLNYDHPAAFETELLCSHLRALKRGECVDAPIYDYTTHNRSGEVRHIVPAKVFIIEGILVLSEKELCSEMDIRIFVDTDADVRLSRRILRDVEKRGRSLESVVDQYFTTVKPMHELFVDPSKKNADIIIPEGGKNEVALAIVVNMIANHLRKAE